MEPILEDNDQELVHSISLRSQPVINPPESPIASMQQKSLQGKSHLKLAMMASPEVNVSCSKSITGR